MKPETIERFSDGLVVFFALWTLVHQAAYFAQLTFVVTWCLAWITAAVGTFVFVRWHPGATADDGAAPRGAGWALPIAVIVAMVLAVCLVRADADDEDYLGYAVLALDHRVLPMLATPPMKLGYALSSYNFLVASLAWATHVPVLACYYFLFAAVAAALLVLIQWRLFAVLGLRDRTMALVGFFVVMLAWGDIHRTPANFGLVRLFQGKAALVSLLLSAAIVYWSRLLDRPDGRSAGLLVLLFVAGVGLSPTGVPLGLVILGFLLGATVAARGLRSDPLVLVASAISTSYLVAVGLAMRYYFGHVNLGVSAEDGLRLWVPLPPGVVLPGIARTSVPGFVTTREMLAFVLGDGARAVIAIVCVALLPLTLPRSAHRRLLSIYALACAALMLFPWTAQWLARWSFSTMSWRWLYAIPFVAAILCAIDRIDDLKVGRAARRGTMLLALAVFVLVSPRWVLSRANWTRLASPSYKLQDPTALTIRPYKNWALFGGLAPLASGGRIEGARLVSPLTGQRY